jgi:hypothetical protein
MVRTERGYIPLRGTAPGATMVSQRKRHLHMTK